MDSILLQGGVALIPDSQGLCTGASIDILIVGSIIHKLEQDIKDIPQNCTVIDCRGKIVSPGFVDTHRHMWQTQLRGRHADETFDDYVDTGMTASRFFEPIDVFWGELGSAMECIDAGTTTVLDHGHMVRSREHARAALSALNVSGLRAAYCLAPAKERGQGNSAGDQPQRLPEWFDQLLAELSVENPWCQGRVSLGFGFDLFHMPSMEMKRVFGNLRRLGVTPISSHHFAGDHGVNAIEPLIQNDLLDSDIILSHICGATSKQVAQLVAKDVGISITPVSECMLGLGVPMTFADQLNGNCALGGDNPSLATGFLPDQARSALYLARDSKYQEDSRRARKRNIEGLDVQRTFSMMTLMGAKILGLEGRIGSLEVGKCADLVIFDAQTPSMVCAAQLDPVAAITMHSSPKDVDTVIVDGRICKHQGKLLPTTGPTDEFCPFQGRLSWAAISDNLWQSCTVVDAKIRKEREE